LTLTLTFLRYLAVQVVAYGIDVGVFFALFATGVAVPVVANLGGKLCAGGVAFLAHRRFTFRVQQPQGRASEAVKYFTLLALNAPISSLLLAGLLLFVTNVMAAKILADVLSVGLTFTLTKYVVFGARRRSVSHAADTRARSSEP